MQPELKVNILLVDDNPNNLLALEAVLGRLNQNLIKAKSGEEALRCLLQQDFAVILLDVKMPGMDGFETATLIRQRERSRYVPIIFLTASGGSDRLAFRGYSLGAVDYLVKPIETEILLSKVMVFVDLHKKTEQVKQQAAKISQLNAELEQRVIERTAQLEAANREKDELLKSEQIARVKAETAEAALRAHASELASLTDMLTLTNSALEKRNQELDRFAYVVSHDLKAPLRAIANLSQWLEEDFQDELNEEIQQHLELMRGRVRRMENLIDGLLQYYRVGRVRMESETVEVEKLLKEIINSLDPPPGFTIEIQKGMPTLFAVRLLLEQVFTNLISNAIKHHDRPQGTIKITGQKKDNFYEFSISDNGPGIPLEYQEKIFDIFQTIHSKNSQENTGIGLSLVKKIVEGEGGKIYLESQEGQGTTICFTWLYSVQTVDA